MSTIWDVIAGVLLIGVALAGTVLKRLSFTAASFSDAAVFAFRSEAGGWKRASAARERVGESEG